MAVVITKQPVGGFAGGKPFNLSVVATGATGYQWKKAKTATSVTGATIIAGATAAAYAVPVDSIDGAGFIFCVLSDADGGSVNSEIVTVIMEPKYITGKFVNAYVAACDQTVKDRFTKAKALSRVEYPDTEDVLRTVQVELFMSVL